MRITAIILLAACLQVSAAGRAQTVTLSEKNAPLQKVFSDIKRQTGYTFAYTESLLSHAAKVTFDLHQASLQDALKACFTNQPFTYEIIEKTIVIKAKTLPQPALAIEPGQAPMAFAIDVHGHVTDSLGNPLAGASVTVKGHSGASAVTDADGNFTIGGINDDATLLISNVGYEAQEIKLKGRSDISLRMRPHSNTLLDVVVSKGYYNTSQRLNTGDVTKVNGEDISKQPVTDPMLALEARVPGLYIQQTNGAPGSYATIMIRGRNSISNGNDPFYIVDGVPFSSVSLTNLYEGGGILGMPAGTTSNLNGQGMSPFNLLNPGDIESIEVLKDADATAIYGSRGANGVILITTKKGKAGPTRVDINVNTGAGKITRRLPLLNTRQYLAMRHEAFMNDGDIPQPYDYDVNGVWDTTRYTDWQKVLVGKASVYTNAQASISGGNASTQYLISGSFNRQGVVFPGDYADQKATGHFSLTSASADKRFLVQLSAGYTSDNSNLSNADPTGNILLPPDAPAIDDKYGNLNWQTLGGAATWFNPLSYTAQHANAISSNLLSNLTLSYEILPGLQLKGSFGYIESGMKQANILPSTYFPPPVNTDPTTRKNIFGTTETKTWSIEPQLSYRIRIAKGQLNVLAGSTFQQNISDIIGQRAIGFASDALISDPQAASVTEIDGLSHTEYHYDAIFGRINYDWEEKYLINITARRDGSSRFGPGKQFGDFGSVGAGWIFSKEHFIQNSLSFLSFGKIRTSYGSTGSDQIGDYQYLSTYVPAGQTYQGQGSVGMIPIGLTNPYFAWELDKKLEAGLELGFINDRIFFSASYYRNRSGNQLINSALPLVTGFNSITANFPATVQNTGIEITINTVNLKTKSFSWNSSFNLTIPENKIISFPGLENNPGYQHSYAVGHSIQSRFAFHYTGVDPQTGVYTFASKDGSGIPSSPQDLYITKPITQQYYGGLQNSFNYRGIQLDVLFQFVKQRGLNYLNAFPNVPGSMSNQPDYVLSRWQQPGEQTNIQRFASGSNYIAGNAFYNLFASDAEITDASFIRLKSLSLSYQLPAAWQKKMHLQNERIYISCQNLFTITRYSGIDPENQLLLPPLRMITAGLQVSL